MCKSLRSFPAPFIDDVLRRKYHFQPLELTAESFLQWTAEDVHDISFGSIRKVVRKKAWRPQWKTRRIPLPYIRLIHQLQLEDEHGNSNQGHEAQRRKSYAQRVLDQLAEELEAVKEPGPQWRSKVLTPIMQRQLQGVCDTYSPSVEAAVYAGDPLDSDDENEEEVTIGDATYFYLDRDPLDPSEIPNYRRNLIYVHQMKWHLAIVLQKFPVTSIAFYNKSLANHDTQMKSKELPDDQDSTRTPLFSRHDATHIVYSFLEEYFRNDLEHRDQVSIAFLAL